MFEEMIREGKPKLDFSGTGDYEVRLTLVRDIRNPQFPRFLEKAGAEQRLSFTVEDLLVLDFLQREELTPQDLKGSLGRLLGRRGLDPILFT
jgi:hypothetical protein